MRLSHTLLLVSMLSFGGFMISKLVYAMVIPSSDVRVIPQKTDGPLLTPTPVSAPAPSEEQTTGPLQSCPLLREQPDERNVADQSSKKGSVGNEAKSQESKPSTCCCDLKRKRLRLI